MMDELREELAAEQHQIWAHWMKWLFEVSDVSSEGLTIINEKNTRRWKRQMETDYDDLSEVEKNSDREQADKILEVLKQAERKA